MTVMNKYNNRIKELRIDSNLSQEELADKLNINSVTLSRYESGHRSPPFDTLKRLSEVFDGISIEYIMGEIKIPSIDTELENHRTVMITEKELNRFIEIERKYNKIKALVND